MYKSTGRDVVKSKGNSKMKKFAGGGVKSKGNSKMNKSKGSSKMMMSKGGSVMAGNANRRRFNNS
jgi:hypothetical protein